MAKMSRRTLLGTAASMAAVGKARAEESVASTKRPAANSPKAPFKTMREYIGALESHGLVIRIPRVDQDAYEGTALMYRARDIHGMRGAPAFLFEEVKIDGNWIKGPLSINECGHCFGECIALGLEIVDGHSALANPFDSYRYARQHVYQKVANNDGEHPLIDPVEVSSDQALCKEVVLSGDDIDLTKFAFVQGNPADAGRYINTGCVFTRDPDYGVNMGVYRCHLRGPREIAINSEPGQSGYRHLMAARARGEKTARVSIALTPDPYSWTVAGSKMSYTGKGLADELALAGGLAGQAIEVVKSETNDFMVPAHAEMIIEGEVPLDDLRPEGPYAEMVGYQGPEKAEAFWMNVTRVTHRKNPWLMNNFTGVQVGTLKAAGDARELYLKQKKYPEILDSYYDTRSVGITFVSIRKTEAGQGMKIAEAVLKDSFAAKIVIVVDEDVDILDQEQVLAALGARWQPYNRSKLFESLPALPLDPSIVNEGRTSKIAIDATRQFPEEGGPTTFPPMNRTLFSEGAPNALSNVDEKWGRLLLDWEAGSA